MFMDWFCPYCRSVLIDEDVRMHYRCSNCGRVWHIKIVEEFIRGNNSFIK